MSVQTRALIDAAFPAGIALIIYDYFRPRSKDTRRVAKDGAYELCANMTNDFELMIIGACVGGHEEIVRLAYYLAEKHSRKMSGAWDECLYGACRNGAESLINFAIAHGANSWSLGMQGAAKGGNLALFRRMYSHAKSSHACDGLEFVMNAACASGNMALIELVASLCGSDTPWTMKSACRYGHMDALRFIIGKGAKDWYVGLEGACEYGQIEVVRFLIEEIKETRKCEMSRETRKREETKGLDWDIGLRAAIGGGHLEIVRLMLEMGADASESLAQACKSGDDAIIRVLIGHGADGWDGGLRCASMAGHLRAAMTMVEHGATDLKRCALAALNNDNIHVAAYLTRVLSERREPASEGPPMHPAPYNEIQDHWARKMFE